MYTNSSGGLDNAEWGTICDDFWDIADASVVCRQLGFPDTVAAPRSAHYGQGIGPIWLSNVSCHGNELDFLACGHTGIGNHICQHTKDSSVECVGMCISITKLQLKAICCEKLAEQSTMLYSSYSSILILQMCVGTCMCLHVYHELKLQNMVCTCTMLHTILACILMLVITHDTQQMRLMSSHLICYTTCVV